MFHAQKFVDLLGPLVSWGASELSVRIIRPWGPWGALELKKFTPGAQGAPWGEFQNRLVPFRTFQNLSELFRTFQNLSHPFRTWPRCVGPFRTFQNLAKVRNSPRWPLASWGRPGPPGPPRAFLGFGRFWAPCRISKCRNCPLGFGVVQKKKIKK